MTPPVEERSIHRRLGLQDVVIEQVATVARVISSGGDATNAIGALFVLCTPYLNDLEGWRERWDARKVRSVKDEESGELVPVPSGRDNQEAFELLMAGLGEAGVLFERVRVSHIGNRPEGPELVVGSEGVGGDSTAGTNGAAASGVNGGGTMPRYDVGLDNDGLRVVPSVVPRVTPLGLAEGVKRGPGRPRKDAQQPKREEGDKGRPPTPSNLGSQPARESQGDGHD